MKRVIVGSLMLATALVVLVVGAVILVPGQVIAIGQAVTAWRAGLWAGSVDVEGYEVHYLSGGRVGGPTVLLLHGMADQKHSFAASAGELTDSYHVLLPDLAGHGDNDRDPSRRYAIADQVALVDGLADALGLERFSLVGNSMGGHVAAAYALAHPDRVERLVLVDAPGLSLGGPEVYAGLDGPLAGRADFAELMSRVVHESPSLPGPIVDHLIESTNADVDFVNRMAADVREGADHDLAARAPDIQSTTLVLQGEFDRVVTRDVADAWARSIPEATLAVLPAAGHSPQLEQPVVVGRRIAAFLDDG